MEYTTRCKVRGCTKTFISAPFEVPIVGQPQERIGKFVAALMNHMDSKHPEQMAKMKGSIEQYVGFVLGVAFEIEDPQLLQMREDVRAALHRFTRREFITDADILDRVARIGLNPEEQEGVYTLLRDMRDILCEEGRYAPASLAPSPLVTA
jgi:hypothetical protein